MSSIGIILMPCIFVIILFLNNNEWLWSTFAKIKVPSIKNNPTQEKQFFMMTYKIYVILLANVRGLYTYYN